MGFQKVAANRGIEWIKSAFQITMRNPGVFVVIALIIAVLGAIPILNLATIVIGPALYGGFMYAAQKQDRGEMPQIGDVFAAFQIPGKIGPMIMLCLPTVVVAVVLGVLGFVLIGGVFLAAMNGSSGLGAAGMGGVALFALLAIVVTLVLAAMMFFAIPRVMLGNIEPIAALKESISAVMANIGAVIIFLAVLFGGFLLGAIVIGWIPIIGALVLMLAATTLFTLGSYSAYKDVFGDVAPPPAPMS